jgi:hypothetical protein
MLCGNQNLVAAEHKFSPPTGDPAFANPTDWLQAMILHADQIAIVQRFDGLCAVVVFPSDISIGGRVNRQAVFAGAEVLVTDRVIPRQGFIDMPYPACRLRSTLRRAFRAGETGSRIEAIQCENPDFDRRQSIHYTSARYTCKK